LISIIFQKFLNRWWALLRNILKITVAG